MTTRREFFVNISLLGTALAGGHVYAQAAKVDEKDPQAAALGYKSDTTKVDQAKFPKHAATQACKNCQLFQGKATDATGGCPLFSGKVVAASGWCSAYNQKAG